MCGGVCGTACLGHTFVSLFGGCIQLEISRMLSEKADEWHFSDFIDLGLRQGKRWPQVTQQDAGNFRGPNGEGMSYVLPSKF